MINQKGVAQLFLIFLLLVGIVAGVYGVQYARTILQPKAYDLPSVTLTNASGIGLSETTSDPNVYLLIRLPQGLETNNTKYQFIKEVKAQEFGSELYKHSAATLEIQSECSKGHSGLENRHIDLSIKQDTLRLEDSIWTTITDEVEHKTYVIAVGIWGYASYSMHGFILPILSRDGSKLVNLASNRTYTVSLYNAPFVRDNPNLRDPIVQEKITTSECEVSNSGQDIFVPETFKLKEIKIYNQDFGIGGSEPLTITSDFDQVLNKPINWKLNSISQDGNNKNRSVWVEFKGVSGDSEKIFLASDYIELEKESKDPEGEILVDAIIDISYEDIHAQRDWIKDVVDSYLNEKLTNFGVKRKLKLNSITVQPMEKSCNDAWKSTKYDLKNSRIRILVSKDDFRSFAVPWQDWTCISNPLVEGKINEWTKNVVMHEVGHLLGLPDYYMQDVEAGDNQVVPMGITSDLKDVMWRTEPFFGENSVKIVNNLTDSLPGNIEAWKYYAPKNFILQLVEDNGLPLPGARVEVYPQVFDADNLRFYIPKNVSFVRVTDNTGRVYLGDQESIFRHRRIANPYSGGSALLKIESGGKVRYATITLSQLNSLYLDKGQTNFAMITLPFSQLISYDNNEIFKSMQGFNKTVDDITSNQDKDEAREHLLQHLRVSGQIK